MTALLVAIEGADGAGKYTASTGLKSALNTLGISAALFSFPRYQETVGGYILGEFLSGRLPRKASPKAAAVLYGLDRLESIDVIAQAASDYDVIIFDRYVASNMVYQAAKVDRKEAAELMDWIWHLEISQFGVIPPDISIYLDTSIDHSRELMALKNRRSYTERVLDEHEADLSLQAQVRENYSEIVSKGSFGRWHRVRSHTVQGLRSPDAIVKEILELLAPYFDHSSSRFNKRDIFP